VFRFLEWQRAFFLDAPEPVTTLRWSSDGASIAAQASSGATWILSTPQEALYRVVPPGSPTTALSWVIACSSSSSSSSSSSRSGSSGSSSDSDSGQATVAPPPLKALLLPTVPLQTWMHPPEVLPGLGEDASMMSFAAWDSEAATCAAASGLDGSEWGGAGREGWGAPSTAAAAYSETTARALLARAADPEAPRNALYQAALGVARLCSSLGGGSGGSAGIGSGERPGIPGHSASLPTLLAASPLQPLAVLATLSSSAPTAGGRGAATIRLLAHGALPLLTLSASTSAPSIVPMGLSLSPTCASLAALWASSAGPAPALSLVHLTTPLGGMLHGGGGGGGGTLPPHAALSLLARVLPLGDAAARMLGRAVGLLCREWASAQTAIGGAAKKLEAALRNSSSSAAEGDRARAVAARFFPHSPTPLAAAELWRTSAVGATPGGGLTHWLEVDMGESGLCKLARAVEAALAGMEALVVTRAVPALEHWLGGVVGPLVAASSAGGRAGAQGEGGEGEEWEEEEGGEEEEGEEWLDGGVGSGGDASFFTQERSGWQEGRGGISPGEAVLGLAFGDLLALAEELTRLLELMQTLRCSLTHARAVYAALFLHLRLLLRADETSLPAAAPRGLPNRRAPLAPSRAPSAMPRHLLPADLHLLRQALAPEQGAVEAVEEGGVSVADVDEEGKTASAVGGGAQEEGEADYLGLWAKASPKKPPPPAATAAPPSSDQLFDAFLPYSITSFLQMCPPSAAPPGIDPLEELSWSLSTPMSAYGGGRGLAELASLSSQPPTTPKLAPSVASHLSALLRRWRSLCAGREAAAALGCRVSCAVCLPAAPLSTSLEGGDGQAGLELAKRTACSFFDDGPKEGEQEGVGGGADAGEEEGGEGEVKNEEEEEEAEEEVLGVASVFFAEKPGVSTPFSPPVSSFTIGSSSAKDFHVVFTPLPSNPALALLLAIKSPRLPPKVPLTQSTAYCALLQLPKGASVGASCVYAPLPGSAAAAVASSAAMGGGYVTSAKLPSDSSRQIALLLFSAGGLEAGFQRQQQRGGGEGAAEEEGGGGEERGGEKGQQQPLFLSLAQFNYRDVPLFAVPHAFTRPSTLTPPCFADECSSAASFLNAAERDAPPPSTLNGNTFAEPSFVTWCTSSLRPRPLLAFLNKVRDMGRDGGAASGGGWGLGLGAERTISSDLALSKMVQLDCSGPRGVCVVLGFAPMKKLWVLDMEEDEEESEEEESENEMAD
jgi:hypothetical protein